MDKKRVLVVDDSADDIHFVMATLTREYAVLAATNGKKALQLAAADPQPDVILMDVEMPGMNGYETCAALKNEPLTRDIDVIFVSSHDTVEEKLAGYDAGGSDYLIKPVQPAELLQKVSMAVSNRQLQLASAYAANSATNTAMTAMTNVGEMGIVIAFMRESLAVTNLQALAELIVDCSTRFGLMNTVLLADAENAVYASTKQVIPPLEKELLNRVGDDVRILDKGNRLILNFGLVKQLITNLPEDQDKRGRLRDHLAILLEGAQARVKALNFELKLPAVIKNAMQTLTQIEQSQQAQKSVAMQIMDNLLHDIEEQFLNYGLTEEQEKVLLAMVESAVSQSLENFEAGQQLDLELQAIIQQLKEFT